MADLNTSASKRHRRRRSAVLARRYRTPLTLRGAVCVSWRPQRTAAGLFFVPTRLTSYTGGQQPLRATPERMDGGAVLNSVFSLAGGSFRHIKQEKQPVRDFPLPAVTQVQIIGQRALSVAAPTQSLLISCTGFELFANDIFLLRSDKRP